MRLNFFEMVYILMCRKSSVAIHKCIIRTTKEADIHMKVNSNFCMRIIHTSVIIIV